MRLKRSYFMFSKKIILAIFIAYLAHANLQARSYYGPSTGENIALGVLDAIIANENNKRYYNEQRRHRPPSKRYKKKRRVKKVVIPKVTNEMKIQKALLALGFYQGAINGEVNSFDTREAIRVMNQSYGLGDTTSLNSDTKDTLIYLSELYQFDKNLASESKNGKEKWKKVQTALKILGFYHAKIDGLVGSGTRRSISQYKASQGLGDGNKLDFEDEYQLVNRARERNDNTIKRTQASLNRSTQNVAPKVYNNNSTQPTPDVVATSSGLYPNTNQQPKIDMNNQPAPNNNEQHLGSKPLEEQKTVTYSAQECLSMVNFFDDVVKSGKKPNLRSLGVTADSLINVCKLKKTKTGKISETMDRLRSEQNITKPTISIKAPLSAEELAAQELKKLQED